MADGHDDDDDDETEMVKDRLIVHDRWWAMDDAWRLTIDD